MVKVRFWTDARWANIALMKLARYHRDRGHDIGFHAPVFDCDSDILYCSKLFRFTADYEYQVARNIVKGGTGYDVKGKLPEDIDSILDLDYSIYPDCDYSMQFFSRGCIRKCPFCVVREKEGRIHPVIPMNLNPHGKRIHVLDNNFFANPEWREAGRVLKSYGQPVDFSSGIDIRLFDEEQAIFLNELRLFKQVHIAWDNPRQRIDKKIQQAIKCIKPYKLMCYVLIGYWSTPEEDLYRVERLRELGVAPFVMAFDRTNRYQRDFQRWCNHKAIFGSVPWNEYNKKRVGPKDVESSQLELF